MFSDNRHTVVNERELFDCYVTLHKNETQYFRDKTSIVFRIVFYDEKLKLFDDNTYMFRRLFIENFIQDIYTNSWIHYFDFMYSSEWSTVIVTEKSFDNSTAEKFLNLEMTNAKCCIFGDTLKIMF